MKFPKGNTILYYQDFKMHESVPHNVDFEVTIDDYKMHLQGPGYGKSGDYGNGALTITMNNPETMLSTLSDSLGEITYRLLKNKFKSDVRELIKDL